MGELIDKAKGMANQAAGKAKQAYGDAAVIMGQYTERHQSRGQERVIAGRFTDTYIKRGGKWKCVASHDSVAVKD